MASMSGPGSDSHDDGQSVAAAWQAPLNSIILFLTAMDMRTEETNLWFYILSSEKGLIQARPTATQYPLSSLKPFQRHYKRVKT